MPCPFQIFSQSGYLIWIVAINSHSLWQTVQIQIGWLLRSQLIWNYTVCKDRTYLGSAGLGLTYLDGCINPFHTEITPPHYILDESNFRLCDLDIPREKLQNYLKECKLIRQHILLCLIWVCTVPQSPF